MDVVRIFLVFVSLYKISCHATNAYRSFDTLVFDHGWKMDVFRSDGVCNLPRMHAQLVSEFKFKSLFFETSPIILEFRDPARNGRFRTATARDVILRRFGNCSAILSTANTQSYRKRKVFLREYIENEVEQDLYSAEIRSDNVWYWFGDHAGEDEKTWSELFDLYELPKHALGAKSIAFSFGIGARASGVPLHTHGAVFAETIIGRKRWFLLPPHVKPTFDGDELAVSWVKRMDFSFEVDRYLKNEYTKSPAEYPNLLACTLHPGEVLFIPHLWWHATLNLEQNVFISAFV